MGQRNKSGRKMALASMVMAVAGCTKGTESPPLSEADTPTPAAVLASELPARPLRLGRPPHLVDTRAEYTPLAEHLGKKIGHRITVVVPASYDEVVDHLVEGKLDLALLTPFTYVKAKEKMPDLWLLATMMAEGFPRYRGYVVVSADSALNSLSDLRGKSFAFVDRASTSGFLFPTDLLLEAGIDPHRDFREIRWGGSHPTVAEWVIHGRVDAGAISSTTFMHLRNEAIANRLSIIAKTDWIPFDAFVAHPSVPTSVVSQLRQTLLELSLRTPENRQVLTGKTITNGFVAVDDAAYDPVRRVAERVGERSAAP